jgi:hypothetical protein
MKRSFALLLSLAAVLAATATAQAASTVYFQGADAGRVVTPKTLFLTGDGTLDVFHASWQAWGGAQAIGHGTAEYHGCTPSCAAGKPHSAAVTVKLSGRVSCSGRTYYNRVTLIKRSGGELFASYLRNNNWAPCKRP